MELYCPICKDKVADNEDFDCLGEEDFVCLCCERQINVVKDPFEIIITMPQPY